VSFHSPHLLWLLVPLVLLFSWELARRAANAAADLPKVARAWAGAFDVALGTRHTTADTRARIWLWFGLALSVIALARPQWGVIEEKVFDQSREVLIAVDLSRSMMAQDVKPSRLDRSKLLITSLLDGLKGERVGLVLFAGTAFLQSPLSADYEILREFLPALKPDFLPEGGSNYKAMLETSMQAFGTSTADRYLIILSDGESTEEGWKELGEQLKAKGIRVIGLGVGTTQGSFIPDGSGGFVKDDRGAVVLSRLNSSSLQDLAQTTAGAYTDASAWIDMPSLLKKTVEAGKKGEFSEKNTARKIERFQWFLAPGLLLLFISFWAEFPVRPRERALPLGGKARGQKTENRGRKAAIASIAALLLSSVFCPPSSVAAAEDTLAKPLTTTVARLADKPALAPKDCADLAQTTITYGQRMKTGQQRPPESVIRDALAAVDLGEKADAKAADWPRLRQELEQLLEKPPEDKKQDQKQDEQQKQDQKNQQQNQQSQDQQNQDPQQQPQQDQQNSEQQKQEQQQQKQQQDAFGDMKDQQEPPKTDEEKEPPQQPPQPQTQKVGGQKEKKMEVPLDPDLAMPLQKLEQVRNQDSPAKLQQLMQGQPQKSAPKKGKDW
jgi:Ca-activated chloride channel family protein